MEPQASCFFRRLENGRQRGGLASCLHSLPVWTGVHVITAWSFSSRFAIGNRRRGPLGAAAAGAVRA